MNKSQVKWETCGLILKVNEAEWLGQVDLGTYLSIYLSIYLFIYLSISIFIYLYIMKLVVGYQEACWNWDGRRRV